MAEAIATGLWEREAALAAIARLVEHARDGRGGSLFIHGEAGLGKTSLLAAGHRIAASDMRVGAAHGDAMETWFPFGLIAPALRQLGGPDLLDGSREPVLGADPRASRFMGVLRWLEASSQPLLMTLDDLHWADADSLALAAFLARRLGDLPVALLGSLRPWPSQAEEVVSALVHDGHASVEQLRPLSPEAASGLIIARVGQPVEADVVRSARQLCAGNPLLLEQVALTIQRGEDVPEREESAAPSALGLLLARFAGLPPSGLRCAEAGSVLGSTFRSDVAAEMAQLGAADAAAAVEALCRSGLTRSVGGSRLEFVHPLFSQALYEGMAPVVRTGMHRRAFVLLSEVGADTEATEHAVRGDLAGDSRAIELLESAGRRALATGALEAAATNLQAAVELAGDRAEPTLLLSLGEAQLAVAQVVEARSTLEGLLRREGLHGLTRGRALRQLARALYVAGESRLADERFEQAVADLRPHDVTAAVEALLDNAFACTLTGGTAAALALAGRARDLAGEASEAVRRRADAAWGIVLFQSGDDSGVPAMEAAARAVEADPVAQAADVCSVFGVLNSLAQTAAMAERFDEGERTLDVGLAAAERAGAPEAIASLANIKGWMLTRMGRLPEALEHMDRTGALTDLVPFIEGFNAVGRGYILQLMGRLEESESCCRLAEAAAVARGQTNALLFLGEVRGHRALREGRLQEAAAHYEALEALVTRTGNREPCIGAWGRHAVSAYLGCGREADARRVIAWLVDCAEGLPCRWPRIAAASGRALLAQRAGDHEAAEAEFRMALTLHEGTEQSVEEAETLLEYGAFLRRAGRAVRARPLLAQGLELAEASGATWMAGYLRAELAVAGGRRRRRGPLERLTAQEQRVAELAAAGLSNREMADRLSLSVATVETHLHRVYAKLEIHSRRELMKMRMHVRPELNEAGP